MTFFRTIIAFVYSGFFSLYSIVWGWVFREQSAWETLRKSWASTCLRIVGIRLHIEGKENLKSPAIFVMNHQSILDLMTSALIAPPKTKYIAKKELLRVPLVGEAVRRSGGCIFIDRASPEKAISSINQTLQGFDQAYSVMVFPEGTRSQQEFPKPFKKGAFFIAKQLGLPIVPIGQAGAIDLGPRKGRPYAVKGTIHLTVGAKIDLSTFDLGAASEAMTLIHDSVCECCRRAIESRDI